MKDLGYRSQVAGRRMRIAICISLLVVVFSAAAMAQSIQVGSAAGDAGSAVNLPIVLDPGSASISTVQFDVMFSSSFSYAGTTTGSAASAAGKSASANPIAGGVRVL